MPLMEICRSRVIAYWSDKSCGLSTASTVQITSSARTSPERRNEPRRIAPRGAAAKGATAVSFLPAS
jgi:hypothetical protein